MERDKAPGNPRGLALCAPINGRPLTPRSLHLEFRPFFQRTGPILRRRCPVSHRSFCPPGPSNSVRPPRGTSGLSISTSGGVMGVTGGMAGWPGLSGSSVPGLPHFLVKRNPFKKREPGRSGPGSLVFHNIMQISPPDPSLMILWRVSRSLVRASSGMRLILEFRSSFTSS